MLLYLKKYLSSDDISNIVRELSKCMDGAAMGSYLEMLRDSWHTKVQNCLA